MDRTVFPEESAAVYTKGLKADPGCLLACSARLNCDAAKSVPPTMARIAPVCGSRATTAP